VASRATGFLRTAVLAAALGVGPVANAFNVANTAPNIVYELLLGGILTSVVVPLLVRALKDGLETGIAYTQRLLGLTLVALGGTVLVLVIAAPLVLRLYLDPGTPTFHLAVVFAVFFFPQVLFYGLGAVLGAYLNAQGRFGPPMWAPVLNNVVVIATGLLFFLVPSPHVFNERTITDTQVGVIGVGVTLGILAQTVALIPSLRAAGLPLRPRFDFRGTGLGAAGRLARWTFFYVVCNQLVLLVVIQLANRVPRNEGASYSSYVYAFLLWQLPHAVVGVSVITALLPAMSRAAADDRIADLREQLDRGLRLSICILVPASAAYIVLGHPIAVLVFGHGRTGIAHAHDIGTLLAVFACGLVAFSTYQLQLRAFYALQDTRTPAFINLAVNATTVVVDVALYLVLPVNERVLGLAAGQASSFLVGVLVCTSVLAKRVPRNPEGFVLRTAVRCAFAVAVPAALAYLVVVLVEHHVGEDLPSALLSLAVGGGLLTVGYARLARRVHVPEVHEVVGPVLARLGR
ncbi:MAG: integral rane protein MviN, partial [Frankiales bacterium]|nr:integral rane protein MviN [Frankiales bacterium]